MADFARIDDIDKPETVAIVARVISKNDAAAVDLLNRSFAAEHSALTQCYGRRGEALAFSSKALSTAPLLTPMCLNALTRRWSS